MVNIEELLGTTEYLTP